MNPSSNQTFSFKRFGRLFRRHTAEHLRGYVMSAAVLAGALLLVMSYVAYMMGGTLTTGVQMVFFILFILGAGSLFNSILFDEYGEKRRSIMILTLPASHLEKFLVAWLYALPIFLMVFLGVFYLVDAAVVYGGAQPGQAPELLDIWVFTNLREAGSVFLYYAVVSGVWLWGSIFFEKGQFIKTAFAVFLGLGVLWLLNHQVLKQLISPDLAPLPPFSRLAITEGGQSFMLSLPESQTAWLGLVPVALAVLLWVAAYFRVTEKQL